MHKQMSFLETPAAGAALVWAALDEQQRAAVVAALARLIAKVVAAPSEAHTAADEEASDE